MKYSVGQKVITHKFNDPRCVAAMVGYVGKEGIITKVREDGLLPYRVHDWWWAEEALSLPEEESEELAEELEPMAGKMEPPAAPDLTSLDLTKILREGDKIYSTVQGDVEVQVVTEGDFIICKDSKDMTCRYYVSGRYCELGECILFPSRKNRDWSTFKRKPDLKKADIVKVWDDDPTDFAIRVFSHYIHSSSHPFKVFNDFGVSNFKHAEKISIDELKDFE